MAWDLTDEEQSRIMDAVGNLIMDYWVPAEGTFTVKWENEDGSVEDREVPRRGFKVPDTAPELVRALNHVYEDIVDRGATLGGGRPSEEDIEALMSGQAPGDTAPTRDTQRRRPH